MVVELCLFERPFGQMHPRPRAALRRFYKAVGTFGQLQKVIWAESFPAFAGCVQALTKDFCWLVLHSITGGMSRAECLAGCCLRQSLRDELIQVGYLRLDHYDTRHWDSEDLRSDVVFFYHGPAREGVQPDKAYQESHFSSLPSEVLEDFEANFTPFEDHFSNKRSLVPACYDTSYWADIESRIAEGNLSSQSPRALLAHALTECAACFPGPGVAVCCEFPSAILPETALVPVMH